MFFRDYLLSCMLEMDVVWICVLLLGETGASRDAFYFFSNIAENIYDRDFDLTRQGRGILPLQTRLISYVVTSFVATEYGVKDTWSNCPNLPRHGVDWDSTRGT